MYKSAIALSWMASRKPCGIQGERKLRLDAGQGGRPRGWVWASLSLVCSVLSVQAHPHAHISSAIITSIRTEINAGGQIS
ncbi:hypothetical protein KL928_002012 [Ogataea angusta]|uniref:Uncharacterized protein n=1 Tax=Pichia angusta TaxID=870730 RepID=A0AAN6I5Y6_PICAN|nr:uncharacterized protein KL928_002012 [Ogataea angusta]KAG7819338.1 hypothetical protein KL928_002012 [Ogataea angusta]